MASNQNVNGQDIITAKAFAADLGLNYRSKTTMGGYKGEWSFRLALTNMGSKVSYTRDNVVKDFIPINMALGSALRLDLDQYNSLTFALDFNKLMIPTPIAAQIKDDNGNNVPNPKYDCCPKNDIVDYREKSLFSGKLGSFGDAQGGFKEEIKEVSISFGPEYWYDKQFAFRGGYYYESAEKGNRRYFTVGDLTIVAQWLQSFGVDAAGIEAARAPVMVWALERGSRSGRVAYQFARDFSGSRGVAP